LRGGSKELAQVCARRLIENLKGIRKALQMPRALRSRRSTSLAHPGLTDSTGGPGPGLARTRSQDRPARLRFLACATPPGWPQDHLQARARSAADLSPVLPSSAARRSPRPGDFWRVTPLARKRPPKMASWLPVVTSLIAGIAGRKPDHGTGFGEDNHGAAERAAMFAQMRFCMDY
jgi:hypothetical protein